MTSTRPTRRQFVLLAASATAGGIAGCTGDGSESDPSTDEPPASPTPTAPPETATPQPTEDGAVVEMTTDGEGMYFDPKGLLVEPGTTVRFVNASGNHGTTAYHPGNEDRPLRIPEEAEPWDSEIFTEADRSFEVTVEVEGVYDYYCPPHESMGMVGRIVVGEPHDGPATTAPDDLPPGAQDALPSVETILEDETVAGP